MTGEQRLRIAFLVMQDAGDFVTDYELGIEPLRQRGWEVDCIAWRDRSAHWSDYDAVYIGTPWDYTDDSARFLEVLSRIDRSRAILINDLALVRWSLEKTYLKDLAARGAAIIPSTWYRDFDKEYASAFFIEHATHRVVIKPVIGANAADTTVLEKPVSQAILNQLAVTFRDRPFFVQPYIESIETEGEYSLFYLGGRYSHAIRKVPREGDFRVQEEHGGNITSIEPAAGLVALADRVLGMLTPAPVYARADFVNDEQRGYLLMELELIEPSLYLRTAPGAPEQFAEAIDQHIRARMAAAAQSRKD